MKSLTLTALCLIGLTVTASVHAFPWYASGEGIWGANLMTPEERTQYVKHIQGMKSYEECKAYVAAHHKEIQARSQARHVALPPPPATTACEVMQRMGRFSGNAPACPLEKEAPACPADKPPASSGTQFF